MTIYDSVFLIITLPLFITMEQLQKKQREIFTAYNQQAVNAEKVLRELQNAKQEAERVAREEVT